jgi:hypothetical protein
MENKKAEVIFQTRSSDDRRRSEDMRLSLNHEYLDHNPERRVNIRRRRRDRRGLLARLMNTFWKESH